MGIYFIFRVQVSYSQHVHRNEAVNQSERLKEKKNTGSAPQNPRIDARKTFRNSFKAAKVIREEREKVTG